MINIHTQFESAFVYPELMDISLLQCMQNIRHYLHAQKISLREKKEFIIRFLNQVKATRARLSVHECRQKNNSRPDC